MSTAAKILASTRRLTLAGVPEGLDARILADLAGDADGWVLHIARDDARLALLADAIAFFRLDAEILRLPA